MAGLVQTYLTASVCANKAVFEWNQEGLTPRVLEQGFYSRAACFIAIPEYIVHCINPQKMPKRAYRVLEIFKDSRAFNSTIRCVLVAATSVCLFFLRLACALGGMISPELIFTKCSLHKAMVWLTVLKKVEKTLKIDSQLIGFASPLMDQRVRVLCAKYYFEKLLESFETIPTKWHPEEFLSRSVIEVYAFFLQEPLFDRFQSVFMSCLKKAVLSMYEQQLYTKDEIEDCYTTLSPAFELALLGTIVDSFFVSEEGLLNFQDSYGSSPISAESSEKLLPFLEKIKTVRQKIETFSSEQKINLCSYLACRREDISTEGIRECISLIDDMYLKISTLISNASPKACLDAFCLTPTWFQKTMAYLENKIKE